MRAGGADRAFVLFTVGLALGRAASARSQLLQKAEKLSPQIPTHVGSDRLEIVHHHTLSFDLELEELQKRQNERYWTVILSLLKKITQKFGENAVCLGAGQCLYSLTLDGFLASNVLSRQSTL